MPLHQTYVVWNNKGGAGKTTLTFHLCNEYASQHPDQTVLVIDMCPQANVSTALLSSLDKNEQGDKGDVVLSRMIREQKVQKTITLPSGASRQKSFDKTICGYLLSKIDPNVRGDIHSNEFLVSPSESNRFIDRNIRLLCGDSYLEVIAKRLEQERNLMDTGEETPWRRVVCFLKDFIDRLVYKSEVTYTVFIDTNPSFSIYTEMSISAASRMIIPINADDFSRLAVKAMLYLVYGLALDADRERNYDALRNFEFARLAVQNGIRLPNIHLVVNNRVTSKYTKSVKSFDAKAKEVWNTLDAVFSTHPEIFVAERREDYKAEMLDFHTKAIQCLHLGSPLSKLPRHVTMGDEIVQNAGRYANEYLPNLQEIVQKL